MEYKEHTYEVTFNDGRKPETLHNVTAIEIDVEHEILTFVFDSLGITYPYYLPDVKAIRAVD